MSRGYIHALRDLVVDVIFDEGVPEPFEVLLVDNEARTPLLVDSLQNGNTGQVS